MVKFRVGSYKLNDNLNLNFQLNRTIMWDGGRIEDIKYIAKDIHTSNDWKRKMIEIGDEAIEDGRIENAIAYYRMSEFFMYDGDPDKKKYYLLATKMFYEYYADYFESGKVKQYKVPYEDVKLPVMFAKANKEKKGTVLLHGGNDSYIEEFFFSMLYFAEQGYDTYLFEGPGQGGVIRVQRKHFTHEWEKPVKAVLDYLKLDEVTIIGASLGGMLAPRAAAFDDRIKKVIAWSVFTNFKDVLIGMRPKKIQRITNFCMKYNLASIINTIIGAKIKKGDELVKWGFLHGMYAYEAKTPYEYLKKMDQYQIYNIADKIKQDVLIIGATKDHLIDYRTVGAEINTLTNAKSITVRIFTEYESGEAHCNLGNLKLCHDTMINWIGFMKDKQ
ncbi:Lysophospholipase, alpha-beta hydrolase superfamily [Clostridium cavendishii DSM 21758]|uniref:Lysophospholipase, alpha-beta hydrolase superfamily n=1 Tax=Clostridium cavendishii DSM 21758 TaxID=1121302 RepID=A0A1M6MI74_9CLOT|nr:alpha/beta fold hydrolase [Clostridium cavendishii]SHJ83124.1 Lysophospholipase, alpha-beta hydrolase superfamily [Clostridium cavendishii DSM 21758]